MVDVGTILNTILTAGITFVVINFMTPFLYDMWYGNLSDQVTDSSLVTSGNNAFSAFQIMAYVVPGIIILFGFAQAFRKVPNESGY